MLAKAIATVDHLSGGRAEIGLGAGWAEAEYRAFGLPFPPLAERFDLLDEVGGAVRGLLHDGCHHVAGRHVTLDDARLRAPARAGRVPIWIGGSRRAPHRPRVARHADGWNLPFVPPEALPASGRRSPATATPPAATPARSCIGVNVIVCDDEASLAAQFGPRADAVRPGVDHRHQRGADRRRAGPLRCRRSRRRQRGAPGPVGPGALERAAAAVAHLR